MRLNIFHNSFLSKCCFIIYLIFAIHGHAQASKLAAGPNHSMALSDYGVLYSWGSNSHGKLGQGDKVETIYFPNKIEINEKFIAIAAGDEHSIALSTSGEIWTWGKGDSGQLGHGTDENKYIPTKIEINVKFKSIAAGSNHSIAISENGDIWTWGSGFFNGVLGLGEDKLTPTMIKLGEKFVSITAGKIHSIALSEKGDLWTWGFGSSGQLGHGDDKDKLVPTKIQTQEKFKAIAAGANFSVALNDKGEIWEWGYLYCDEMLNYEDIYYIPMKFELEERFSSIEADSLGTIALSKNGAIYTWGSNIPFDDPFPTKISNIKFRDITRGHRHSMAIDEMGDIWTWGDMADGLVGHEKIPDYVFFPLKIKDGPNLGRGPWSPRRHGIFPEEFRKKVKELLLIRRFRKKSNLAKLPRDILYMVIRELAMAEEY